jgi:hypothetical protein
MCDLTFLEYVMATYENAVLLRFGRKERLKLKPFLGVNFGSAPGSGSAIRIPLENGKPV